MSEVKSILDQMERCRADASICGLERPCEDASADQRDVYDAKASSYVRSLDSLAAVAGGKSVIEEADAAASTLEPNTEVLADIIERDPAFQVLLSRDSTLELDEQGTVSIPKQHYRRLVYLAQHALRALHIDPDLKPTGIYDKATRKAVAEFHRRIGVSPEDGAHGAKMGPRTLSALVMRVRHDAYSIKRKFAKAQMQFTKIDGFYIHPGMKDDAPGKEQRLIVREAVRDSMVWMGYMDIDVDVSTPGGMHILREAIAERFGAIDRIGPKSMNRILSHLEEVHRRI